MSSDVVSITQEKVDLHYINLLKRSWELFKKYWSLLLLVWVISFGLQMLISYSLDLMKDSILSFPFILGYWVLALIISAGWLGIYLKISRGEKVVWQDIFAQVSVTPKFFLAQLAVGVLVMIGLILLVIPGIYWSLKYMMVPYIVIDKKSGVNAAFKMSGQMTQGILWKLLAFSFVIVGFNILGLLALGIGLLITIPVSAISGAVLYSVLLKRLGDAGKLADKKTTVSSLPATTATTAVATSNSTEDDEAAE